MAVDQALATISDHLYSGAIVGYSAGIMALCGDYAFGRSARKQTAKDNAILAAVESATVPQPALVGASHPLIDERVDRSPDDAAAGTDPGLGVGADPSERLADKLGLVGVVVTALGLLSQTLSLALRGIAIGRLPWGNMFEFASLISIIAVATYLVMMGTKPKQRFIGVFVMPPIVLILVLAGLRLYVQAAPVVAALRSYWLAIHVSAASIATGIFFVSTVASALYLVKVRHERKEADAGEHLPSRIAGSLPSSAVLDRLAARTVTFAFPIWTFAIICGAIWAEAAWGRYWGWDPKETWAFISWVVYAGYLHARATAGWKGNRAAYLNLLGAATMLFNFAIVNTVVSGLHSYSGLT